MPKFIDRLANAWNAFLSREPTQDFSPRNYYGAISSRKPDRTILNASNERSILTAIYNRIALDVAAVNIRHVRLDENERYKEEINSGLNWCLKLSANRDQTSRAFIQDAVMSMLDEGYVALVPTDCSTNPNYTDSYDILELRVGKILEWYSNDVRVRVFNEDMGRYDDILFRKRNVAIIENPFYAVMNGYSSTFNRLTRKLALLDKNDNSLSSNKLDLVVQLPYALKGESRKKEAEKRRQAITDQLADSEYGIAYIDSTEKITQLSKSVENNLLTQIEYLVKQVYSYLGITESILNGTASESEYIQYYNHTIEPILSAITDEMKRKFLTKTAISQNQSIFFYRDQFKLIPANQLAEMGDKYTRNAIMTSNEFRQIIGLKPSVDPDADALRNKNLNKSDAEISAENGEMEANTQEDGNDSTGQIDSMGVMDKPISDYM